MRKLLLFCTMFMLAGGQPINIPVTASGWKFGPNTGPYGTNGCFAGNGTAPCTQDLGVSPAHFQEYQPGYTIDGFYTVKLSIANQLPHYPAYGTIEIYYGTQELCDANVWGTGPASPVIFVCPSPGYLIINQGLPGPTPPQGQHNLVLSLHGSNWEDLFDNVSLTFTPQP